MDDNGQFYKEKYETSEKNLQNLKDLAHKGVADYEDLKKKYDQNHKQYDIVRAELEECQAQLQQVTKLIQPAYEEYNELETKFAIEEQLKNEAERFAAKVTNQNSKLKRQSQMLLDIVNDKGVSITDLATITQEDEETESEANKESQDDHYNKIISELRDQLAATETKLKTAKDENEQAAEREKVWKNKYELEKENTHRMKSSLEQHQSSLKTFKRVSTMAYKEFEDLKTKYEMEQDLKTEAMKYASEILSQKNAIQRQSVAAITDAAGDQRVHKAFMEIEELTKTLESERHKHKKEVEELQSALDMSDDVQSVSKLQEQIEAFNEQATNLKKQLADITLWRDKLEKENRELTDKLDVANQRLNPPAPPPPPPPPIPPILRPLAKIMGRKKKAAPGQKAQGANVKGNPAFNSALDEMMQRIRKGDLRSGLRATTSRRSGDEKILERSLHSEGSLPPSLPESPTSKESSSMNELHSLLSNLKRSKSVDVGRSSNTEDSGNELLDTFKKVRGRNQQNLSLIDESSEDKDDSRNSKDTTDASTTDDVFAGQDQ